MTYPEWCATSALRRQAAALELRDRLVEILLDDLEARVRPGAARDHLGACIDRFVEVNSDLWGAPSAPSPPLYILRDRAFTLALGSAGAALPGRAAAMASIDGLQPLPMTADDTIESFAAFNAINVLACGIFARKLPEHPHLNAVRDAIAARIYLCRAVRARNPHLLGVARGEVPGAQYADEAAFSRYMSRMVSVEYPTIRLMREEEDRRMGAVPDLQLDAHQLPPEPRQEALSELGADCLVSIIRR